MREKRVYVFNYDYGTGSTFKCFLTDSIEKVLGSYPEFTLVDWKDFEVPEDVKPTLVSQAFDIDCDPATDPMLSSLIKARENERLYQEKKKQDFG
jgi:hypothetical protein